MRGVPRVPWGASGAASPLQPRPLQLQLRRPAQPRLVRRWRLPPLAATPASSSDAQGHSGPGAAAQQPPSSAIDSPTRAPAQPTGRESGIGPSSSSSGKSGTSSPTAASAADAATPVAATSSSSSRSSSAAPLVAAPRAEPVSLAGPVAAPPRALAKVPPAAKKPPQIRAPQSPISGFGTFWGLLVLSMAYLHHSTTAFALPSLLPIITSDLALSDSQGALLTAGYTVLYALALVPVGLLADRVDRPRLLSLGIGLWSVLTMLASQTQGFGQLLATRVGFAAAQATQNPICFSLIPELFPTGKTTAMAFYNTAIYAGRALSFAAVILAAQLGVPQGRIGDIGYTLVPLDKVDLSLVSVLYTQGDLAAVTPVYTYAIPGEDGTMPEGSPFSGWRQLLAWLGPPGLLLAVLCLLTVDEPRTAATGGFLGDPIKSSRFLNQPSAKAVGAAGRKAAKAAGPPRRQQLGQQQQQQPWAGGGELTAAGGDAAGAALAPAVPPGGDTAGSIGESLGKLRQLLASPRFQAITFASAINDMGSWALVSWQATFYQRVFHLEPETYAPLLAVVIPIGGIIGGVGAGAFGDWLNRVGGRHWLTAVGNCVAAPTIALSLLAPDYRQSFAALLVGFALSEAWRAPAAIMVREVSPPGLGSTGSAAHLCIRNLLGGLGPIAVAYLSGRVGLQAAMLWVPACYLLSGLGFVAAEGILKAEERREKEAAAAAGAGGAAAGGSAVGGGGAAK